MPETSEHCTEHCRVFAYGLPADEGRCSNKGGVIHWSQYFLIIRGRVVAADHHVSRLSRHFRSSRDLWRARWQISNSASAHTVHEVDEPAIGSTAVVVNWKEDRCAEAM